MAASNPLMTLEGKKAATNPARMAPSTSWITPASMTATRNASKDFSVAICANTTAARPAAGPLTLVCEPLSQATSNPPTTPLIRPAMSGAFEARAIPRQRGSATKNTTALAARSLGSALR